MKFTQFMGGGSENRTPAYEAPAVSIVEVNIEKGFAVSNPDATLGGWGESDEELYW